MTGMEGTDKPTRVWQGNCPQQEAPSPRAAGPKGGGGIGRVQSPGPRRQKPEPGGPTCGSGRVEGTQGGRIPWLFPSPSDLPLAPPPLDQTKPSLKGDPGLQESALLPPEQSGGGEEGQETEPKTGSLESVSTSSGPGFVPSPGTHQSCKDWTTAWGRGQRVT